MTQSLLEEHRIIAARAPHRVALRRECRYTIRYRSTKPTGDIALIVEDEHGIAHLFCNGQLRLPRSGPRASDRLSRILACRSAWSALPAVAPYIVTELRALIGAA